MRPKRIILCVCPDAQRLSVWRFTLETHGYRVFTASTADEALDIHRSSLVPVDMILSELGTLEGNELVKCVREIHPETRTMQIGHANTPKDFHCMADMFVPAELISSAEILARTRTLMARKRGPKPARRIATRQEFEAAA